MTRAALGSMVRNSSRRPCRASSAIAPASSTPVGPAPTRTKVNSRRRSSSIVASLGLFEGRKNAAAHRGRVFNLLEARGECFPGVLAEITVPRAGREHEIVVGKARVADENFALLGRDSGHLPHQYAAVLLAAQHRADRHRDVRWRQRRRRHLIEQWLEQVVVALVDQRDACPGVPQLIGRGDAAEAGADDDDAGRTLKPAGVAGQARAEMARLKEQQAIE